MKQYIAEKIEQALTLLKQDGVITGEISEITIDRTRDKAHGDFASNIALKTAKAAGKNPRELAQLIIEALGEDAKITKTEIAGPGFINFFVNEGEKFAVIKQILTAKDQFGKSNFGAGKKVQVEFVSANPTGPLHVGHGRGAAYGASVADLLEYVGYQVHREYYVNDAGRQMDILAASVWLRYLQQLGLEFPFPVNGYKGDYIHDIAKSLLEKHSDKFKVELYQLKDGLPADEVDGGDKEKYIDAVITRAKQLLEDSYRTVFDEGLDQILADIEDDLRGFGIVYQNWFSERSLTEDGTVERALTKLQDQGYIYEKDGALWFKSSEFGDEKDRAVKRSNGEYTYFASDIAYHVNKVDRGFDQIIDVWGADHHGYIPRVEAAMTASGVNAEKLKVLLVQFAILYRGGEKAQMSTRSGEFITLRELRDEVGTDAARFFYVMRKSEQHLDFDLDLAKSESSDNPVYYIQYAHARVCSVMRQLQEKGLTFDQQQGEENLVLLTEEQEQKIVKTLAKYPEMILYAAKNREPHQVCHYLRELSNDLHTYYNAHVFIVDEEKLRNARLLLINAVRQVLNNGLELLSVSAPQEM
ncbi:MAG: arginine--tRNA ligase [Gammaproteobacteria bacterium]|nr:MAG: arginine--tRNA ligase [Gammaproteobacteria bacterium]